MLLDFMEELPPLTNEEVRQVFVNTLDLITGFSILFLQCSPADTSQLIPRVRRELPEKNIEVLDLVEPINNLYRLVELRSDKERLNVLFIRGLEKSLEADIKPGYKGLGNYYNLNTVPPILNHLNQQRENFRDHFGNICFVFVLPKFAIRYFVRRAPDFYDWNSGIFEIVDLLNQKIMDLPATAFEQTVPSVSCLKAPTVSNYTKYNILDSYHCLDDWDEKATPSHNYTDVLDFNNCIESDVVDSHHNLDRQVEQAAFLIKSNRYEEAIASYDRVLMINPDLYEAWNSRGNSLNNLGRYEEAIASYDRALTINLFNYEAWNNRGNSLNNLGRYKEALASYDRAMAINPRIHNTWSNRGNSLSKVGRQKGLITSSYIDLDDYEDCYNEGNSLFNLGGYEASIVFYDRVLSINPDLCEAWYNRGNSLFNLGRYEEAINSYNRVIEIKFNHHKAWHNKGGAYLKSGQYLESISCYSQAITIEPTSYSYLYSKGLAQFSISDYVSTFTTWRKAFKYIGDLQVSQYQEDVSRLIQEFIEALIPRFTQPPIQQTLLIPLLKIYKESNVITELGAALVNTLHLIVAPTISDHTANQWLALWCTSSLGHEPAMELPLRLMSTAIEYNKDPAKRQSLWLNLPSEERPILDKALKFLD
jgi:tetratricopeptide (TPR) repeat protein